MRSVSLFAITIWLSLLASDVAEAGIFLPRGRGIFPRIGRVPMGCRSGMCGPRRIGGCGSGNCGPRQGGGCGGGGCGAGGGAPQQGFHEGQNQGGFQGEQGGSASGPGTSPGGRPVAEDEVPAPNLDQQAATHEDPSEQLSDEEKAGKKVLEKSCQGCHLEEKPDVIAALKDWKEEDWKNAIEQVKSGNMPRKPKTITEEEKTQLIAYLESKIKKEKPQAAQEDAPEAPVPGPNPGPNPGQTPAAQPPASQQASSSNPTVDNQFSSSVGDATLDPSKIPGLFAQAHSVGGEQELIEAIQASQIRGPGRSGLLRAQAQFELGDLSKKTSSELAAERRALLGKASGDQAIINQEKVRRIESVIASRESIFSGIKRDIKDELRAQLERRNWSAEEKPEPVIKRPSIAVPDQVELQTRPLSELQQFNSFLKERPSVGTYYSVASPSEGKSQYQVIANDYATDASGVESLATYPILKQLQSGEFFFSVPRSGPKPLLVPAKKVAGKWLIDPLRRISSE